MSLFKEAFDGVAVIGVDEHVWRHTRRGKSSPSDGDTDAIRTRVG